MSKTVLSRKISAKMVFLVLISLLIVAMTFCFYIGKVVAGCAVGFVLVAFFSILYRVYGYENSMYVDRYGYQSDYDYSKLPKSF